MRFTFTPNGRREFVQRDQDSSSFLFFVTAVLSEIVNSICFVAYSFGDNVGYEFESVLVRFAFLHFFAGRSARGEPTPRLTEVWNFFFFFLIFNGAMPLVV